MPSPFDKLRAGSRGLAQPGWTACHSTADLLQYNGVSTTGTRGRDELTHPFTTLHCDCSGGYFVCSFYAERLASCRRKFQWQRRVFSAEHERIHRVTKG